MIVLLKSVLLNIFFKYTYKVVLNVVVNFKTNKSKV